MKNNRTKNTSANLISSLILQGFLLLSGFIFPRFIILQFGSSVNGLSSTINRILSLIGLMQAGAVGASIFTLYKPVASNDYETVGKVIHSSQKYFLKIGLLYLLGSLIVAFFYSSFLASENIESYEIFLAFIALIINGASYIFITSIFDILFSAYQQRFFLSIADLISYVIYYACVTIVLILNLHFLFLFFSHIFGILVKVFFLYFVYKKKFNDKIIKVSDKKSVFPIKNRGYLMGSTIGEQAVGAAPTVIVSTVMGLASSSVFSIYSMIYLSIKTILSQMDYSISPVFGNLVATASDEKIHKTFNCLQFLFIFVGSVLAGCVGFLIMPFINLYTKSFVDISYYYPLLGIFVTIYISIFTVRQSYNYLAEVYGLFKSMFKITLGFAVLGIVVSIVCIVFFGLPYVMIGVLLYQILNTMFTIFTLKRKISWFSFHKLLPRLIILALITTLSIFVSEFFNVSFSSWAYWVLFGIMIFAGASLIFLIYALLFERQELLMLLAYIKSFFSKKKNL